MIGQDARSNRIDDAVCAAGSLIGALIEAGPVNHEQTVIIVEAAVRAVVPNAKAFEIRNSAKRIAAELEAGK